MSEPTVEQLIDEIGRTRQNPAIPREHSAGMTLEELQRTMATIRAALVFAVETAPAAAFEEQLLDAEGEEVWSIGQIIGHCNSAMHSIGSRALELLDVDPGEPPEPLRSWSDIRLMTRDEALDAVSALDVGAFFAMVPGGADLEAASESDFFGTMPARAWLYFMAMHEAEHVEQVRALSA